MRLANIYQTCPKVRWEITWMTVCVHRYGLNKFRLRVNVIAFLFSLSSFLKVKFCKIPPFWDSWRHQDWWFNKFCVSCRIGEVSLLSTRVAVYRVNSVSLPPFPTVAIVSRSQTLYHNCYVGKERIWEHTIQRLVQQHPKKGAPINTFQRLR